MVTKEEIERIAEMMKIELDDHTVHIDRIQKMIEYFDILDKAGAENEELISQERPLNYFREDEHIPYKEKLIESLKGYKGTYIRSPKLS